jgi:succinoglycan biosynthesis protein ExoM
MEPTVGGTVAVCIATCRRPRSLGRLLDSLEGLSWRSGAGGIRVIVVDNDEAGSARTVVEERRESYRWEIRYVAEPRRNIALARNRGIQVALEGGAEWVAFIDDDEVATPGWLEELSRVAGTTGAPIVGGPILPHYQDGVPGWVARGGFFEIPRFPDGAAVGMAFTGNVLLKGEYLRATGARFDEAFGLSGGGDSHFFLRAVRDGAAIAWADRAVVVETVPVSRARTGWILRRAFRVGNRTVACERILLPRRSWMPGRAARAAGRILEGCLLFLPSLVGGRAATVRQLRKIAYGCGCFSALLGTDVAEYGTIHGS